VTDIQIETQYSTGASRQAIEQALVAAGKDLGHLQRADLAEQWNDLTDHAAATMQTLLTLPPSPIGLQAFVPNFERKAKNLTAALADGRLRAVQGVARAA
jgi:hypothetical protein